MLADHSPAVVQLVHFVELRIFTLHKRFDILACIHAVFVHVLQSRKVVQHIEEYIVQKGVVWAVFVKRWSVWFHGVGKSLLIVKQATCPCKRESGLMKNCNIAYDIVHQHTM